MENRNNEMIFEDISSSSKPKRSETVSKVIKKTEEITQTAVKQTKKAAKKAKKAADDYSETSFRNIDKVIKIIAFVVSIGFALLFLVAAVIVLIFDKSLIFVSALILLFGIVIALIFLYLIYGTGLIISQNKEILRRLDD